MSTTTKCMVCKQTISVQLSGPLPQYCDLCSCGVTADFLKSQGLANVVLLTHEKIRFNVYALAVIEPATIRAEVCACLVPNIEEQLKQLNYSNVNAKNMSDYLRGGLRGVFART